MKAIVGLGNPGREYDATRHNVGFEVVNELARRWHARLKPWKSVADVAMAADRGVVLVEPKTFMNLSGEAVQRVAAFHKLDPGDVLVIVDDVQLPLGRVRLRRSGSAGGHYGLKSVIQHVGPEFPRLRIGVGRGDPSWDLADHVLASFLAAERGTIREAIDRAADAAEAFVSEGIEQAMNRFNRDDKGDEQERT